MFQSNVNKFMLKIHSYFNTSAINHSSFSAHNPEYLQTHKTQYKGYAQVIFLAFKSPTPISEYPWLEQLLNLTDSLCIFSILMVSLATKLLLSKIKRKFVTKKDFVAYTSILPLNFQAKPPSVMFFEAFSLLSFLL